MIKRLTAISILFFVMGCGDYSKHILYPDRTIKGNPENTIVFAQIKSEILNDQCINCHTGYHAGYTNYALVKNQASKILNQIQSYQMPKGRPPLSKEKIQLFADWLAAGAPETLQEEEPDSKEAPIDFAQIKNRVLKPYHCTDCHSQYNDYGVVKRQLGSIVSLTISDRMPFPRPKTQHVKIVEAKDKDLLLEWVSQDAPEFSDKPAVTPEKPELQPNWISLRNQVFGPKCILCHNSFAPRGKGSMATHHDILKWFLKKPKMFNFNSPNDSHFIGAILGRIDDDEMFFDTMPNNSPTDDVTNAIAPVTPEELEVIKKWIELKLPEI